MRFVFVWVDNSERKKAPFVYLKAQLWAEVCNTGAGRACGIPVVHMLRRHPKPSKGGMGRLEEMLTGVASVARADKSSQTVKRGAIASSFIRLSGGGMLLLPQEHESPVAKETAVMDPYSSLWIRLDPSRTYAD
ncbi:hypothetical protein EAH_00023080 [Eimeria acervulina]|uniref:Uncharacterized protein n=1 Tax=Eimeria acervulina TaxID=5801 RepID=U6GQX8_EIMAC|nr:hypothetical protein EAH_00023080 [Eimeria acervulina]CDI81668.1 hypothetical protein EAH_00023080 [Eimeria acervulina]